MNEPLRPADMSRELGVLQQTIRNFLRAEYGKLKPPDTRWQLTESQVAAVRRRFGA